jgi:hypothetical protein
MERLVAITLLAIAVAFPALAQRSEKKLAPDGIVQQELLKLEQEWAEAAVKRDLAFFERIEADEYTFTDPTGAVVDVTTLSCANIGTTTIPSGLIPGAVSVALPGSRLCPRALIPS